VEIAPVPHRTTRGEWRRLALGLLVLVPVVLLVLLPAVLGLDRYVVTDRAMGGSLDRGSVVLAREVPPTDLRVGDVVTFARPDVESDELVVRRIVSIEDGAATTRADGAGTPDPWTVPLADSNYARVSVGVPWLGYPFVMDGGWIWLALAAAAALWVALFANWRGPTKVVKPARSELPVY
jgi:signal peptidase